MKYRLPHFLRPTVYILLINLNIRMTVITVRRLLRTKAANTYYVRCTILKRTETLLHEMIEIKTGYVASITTV